MIGHITKIWNNVVEATFKKEELPKVDFILTLHNNTCVLLVKRIIDDTSVRAIVIYQKQSIKIGDQVLNTNDTLKVPVGQAAKNNIYDISGVPMLQQRAKGIKYIEMNSTIRKEKKIYSKHEILETGIKAIDFFMPILKGHNLGILGGAGVGKTVLMKEIIFNSSRSNSAKKNSSIFIGSGERSREGVELYQELEQSNLMKDSMMFISKMDEPPGARMSIVPYGITAAEYLRDVEKEDVLLFIDNIFRFIQAGNEVAPGLNKKPITGGYQATLDTEVSNVEDRLYATEDGSITSFQTLFLPMDDLADPSAVSIFSNLDGSLVLSREQTSKNIFPAFDPLASSSSSVSPDIIGQRHYNAIIEVKSILQKYRDLEDVILILGIDELDNDNKIIVKKALQLQNFFTQNFFVAEAYTKAKGVYVPLEETLESVIRIVEGKYINQSPEIFSFIGSNLNLPTDEELNLNKVDL